jgi:hypothetical protein
MDITPNGATPFGITPKQMQQMVNTDAKAVHSSFIQTLHLLKENLEPSVRRMYLQDLQELQERARKLLDTELVHPITKPLLNHILLRPIDDLSAINSFKGDGKQIVSSFIA